MVFVYSIIYFLIPKYLSKGRYISMILLWLLFSLIGIIVLRVFHLFAISPLRVSLGYSPIIVHQNYFEVILGYFGDLNMLGCLGASIKLGKMWFIKQQELMLLNNEKNRLEVKHTQDDTMRSFFMTDFFYKMMNKLTSESYGPPLNSKKISDVLLYLIYNSNQSKLFLSDEINTVSEFLEIEKAMINAHTSITLKIEGKLYQQTIAPLIILPLVAGSLNKLKLLHLEEKQFNLSVHVLQSDLHIKITLNKPAHTTTLIEKENDYLQNINERLELIYPQGYNFEATILQDQFAIELYIDLDSAIN